MALDSCLWAVRVSDPAQTKVVDRRLEDLRGFYAPLDPRSARHPVGQQVIVGEIGFGRAPVPARATDSGCLLWGGPVPAAAPALRAGALLDASDAELRLLDGLVSVVAWESERAVLVTGTGALASLYRAAHEGIEAFSTHAVAAGWLAAGRPVVRAPAVAELVAHEFVGADMTLLAGVQAVGAATRVVLHPGASTSRCHWPGRARWASVGEPQAVGVAALLESLDRRAGAGGSLALGLTAGLDSRVLALALAECHHDPLTFTWPVAHADDIAGAAQVARALGLAHVVQAPERLEDAAALARARSSVRWSEGQVAVSLGARTYPPGTGTVLTGAGGEVGRCFYYDVESVGPNPHPSPDVLLRVYAPGADRLSGAPRDVVRALRAVRRDHLRRARADGLRGWSCLDHVYAEQRVRHWGRAMTPAGPFGLIAGFDSPLVYAALTSLPVHDRLTSAFHRRFLARRPGLAPAPPVLAPLARSGLGRRIARGLPGLPAVADTARAIGRRTAGAQWGDWAELEGRPQLHGWLTEGVLGAPLVHAALGGAWARSTRGGLLAHRAPAVEATLLAAGAVALDEALREARA